MKHYELSFKNWRTLLKNGTGSCYYCLSVFPAKDVTKWTDGGETPLCPHCGVDSVVPGHIDSNTLILWRRQSFHEVDDTTDHITS